MSGREVRQLQAAEILSCGVGIRMVAPCGAGV
jgi:hypothetical protein